MTALIRNTEAKLIKKLKKGDISAFNELFHQYSGRLYYFALGYLKATPEAEELVQEVFAKVWEKRRELKEELSFKSFLFTIAFNQIKKQFRRKSVADNYFKNMVAKDLDIDTENNIDYNSLIHFLNSIIENLPARRKEVFIKSRFEGLNAKEIAEKLNISQKTVENQLTEALRFIRSKFRSEYFSCAMVLLIFQLFFF